MEKTNSNCKICSKIQIHKTRRSNFICLNRELTHFSSNSHRPTRAPCISYTYTTHTTYPRTLYYRYLAAMNQLIIKGSDVSTSVTESSLLPPAPFFDSDSPRERNIALPLHIIARHSCFPTLSKFTSPGQIIHGGEIA